MVDIFVRRKIGFVNFKMVELTTDEIHRAEIIISRSSLGVQFPFSLCSLSVRLIFSPLPRRFTNLLSESSTASRPLRTCFVRKADKGFIYSESGNGTLYPQYLRNRLYHCRILLMGQVKFKQELFYLLVFLIVSHGIACSSQIVSRSNTFTFSLIADMIESKIISADSSLLQLAIRDSSPPLIAYSLHSALVFLYTPISDTCSVLMIFRFLM